MYAALWRALPGPVVVRVVLAVLLAVAVVVFCFLWLFPRVAPLLPLTDNTVGSALIGPPGIPAGSTPPAGSV